MLAMLPYVWKVLHTPKTYEDSSSLGCLSKVILYILIYTYIYKYIYISFSAWQLCLCPGWMFAIRHCSLGLTHGDVTPRPFVWVLATDAFRQFLTDSQNRVSQVSQNLLICHRVPKVVIPILIVLFV
jgi:hypothetical protein